MSKLFVSYSHKDEPLKNQLVSHLALLVRQGHVEPWHDRCLRAGDDFGAGIDANLESADIILLLISADFLASDYCYSLEMTRAMQRHATGEARVIPVILRHCDWHGAPFGKLLAAPRDGQPVTTWMHIDEALLDVANQIRKALGIRGGVAPASAAAAAPRGDAYSARVPVALPRSSNTRIPRVFTEKDVDDFLHSTFAFACEFFQGSIKAVEEQNPGVTGKVEKIDSRCMTAILYRHGSKVAECSIRRSGLSRSNGIAFSYDSSIMQGSFNELLTVEPGAYELGFKAMGMAWSGRAPKQLNQQETADFLWSLFIRQAQS
ncbi:toll/interleukin-1 receptor domain-containing protein [Roseateles sp. P5_E1]